MHCCCTAKFKFAKAFGLWTISFLRSFVDDYVKCDGKEKKTYKV